jgi:hypothetical protein
MHALLVEIEIRTAAARILVIECTRAVVVLPTPRMPVSMKACGMRPDLNALRSVCTIASCPISVEKLVGRYLRASTR